MQMLVVCEGCGLVSKRRVDRTALMNRFNLRFRAFAKLTHIPMLTLENYEEFVANTMTVRILRPACQPQLLILDCGFHQHSDTLDQAKDELKLARSHFESLLAIARKTENVPCWPGSITTEVIHSPIHSLGCICV